MLDFIKFNFMRNAIWAILIITPLFGFLGTMIIDSKLTFFSDALSHSMMTGVALGAIFSMKNPVISMLVFAIIFSLIVCYVKSKKRSAIDTTISVMASTTMSLGLVLLSKGGFGSYSAYLIGDILSITTNDIIFLLVMFLAVCTGLFAIYNNLIVLNIDSSMAKSKNIKVKFVENAFMILTALFITAAIKWVGVLTINSFLIIPAAASRNFARGMRNYILFSILISVFSGIGGLILSYYINTAAGATMVLIAAIIFFISSIATEIKI